MPREGVDSGVEPDDGVDMRDDSGSLPRPGDASAARRGDRDSAANRGSDTTGAGAWEKEGK